MSLRRPPKPPRTRQVAYRRAHREPLGVATFSGSALRVSHGRSPAAPHIKHQTTRQQAKPRQPPPPQFARHGAHTKPPRIYRDHGGTATHPEYRYAQRCIYPLPRHQGVRALRGRVPCRSKEDICTSHYKTVFQGERKNPADSEESAGFSLKCAPWDSNPEPID